MEVRVGMRAVFDPYLDLNGNGAEVVRGKMEVGTVDFVNYKHRWFQVVYGTGQRISFLFDDIGKGKKVVLYD